MAPKKKPVKRPKKHKPATLQYTIRKFEDYETITEMDQTKAFVYLHLVKAVKDSLPIDAPSVELFYLVGYNSTICLDRSDWKDTLETALTFFAEKELYEKAAECKQLLTKL